MNARKYKNGKDVMSLERFNPKYEKPKILLIDLPDDVLERVQSVGYNASAGTFGSPYKVDKSDDCSPVIIKEFNLPNHTEQEIIFVDLTPPETLDDPEREKLTTDGEPDWWAKCSRGEIDPRPRVMFSVQDSFDRIFRHGGLFVIFAQPHLRQDLVFAKISRGRLNVIEYIEYDNWSFLSVISSVDIKNIYGEEVSIIDYDSDFQLFRLLRKFTKDFRYDATLRPYSKETGWIPILKNKFDDDVGGLIWPEDSKGRVLILPQTSKKSDVVVALLQEVLPEISPHLFPHVEGARWVERDEYELDSVIEYKLGKETVRQRAKRKIEDLDKNIAEERSKLGFLHGILTKTGDDLAADVKLALEFIGFDQVVNVDEEIQEQGCSVQKQEDLQIHDRSPTLLIEVKGISGLPSESDTNQVVKYVARRMKEWDRRDVFGVSVINHQRNLHAIERENENTFSETQVEDAESQYVTLVTTWDIFLLIRGMMKWKWDPKAIQDLFYDSGRMSRIPTIYKPIGNIRKLFPRNDVVGVEISENLSKGDRVGYVIREGYLEEDVSSLQIDGQDVDDAVSGQQIGIKTENLDKLREGMTIYKVSEPE